MTQEGICTNTSELFSPTGAKMNASMNQTRCLHEIVDLSSRDILVVAGEGFNNSFGESEIYCRRRTRFELLKFSNVYLTNLHGHSVTALGDNITALVFGGFDGNQYFNKGFIIDKTNITVAQPPDPIIGLIEKRASSSSNICSTYEFSINYRW